MDFGNYQLPEFELSGSNFIVGPSNLFLASQTTANFTIDNNGYLHVTVPVTGHLPDNAQFKAYIDAYRATTEKPDERTMPGSYSDNIYYAADNWFAIKKHWALELKRLVTARRSLVAAH